MPPTFRSTSVAMKHDEQDQSVVSRWALPGSLAAHGLVVALLIFGLPVSLLEPEEEQAMNVDLVPPPKPPEKTKTEPPPPPEKPKPEEAKAEKPPPASSAQPAPQPVLQPVVRFGEKDAGPRESLEGNSPEEGSASPEAQREPDKQELAEPQALEAAQSKDRAALPEAAEIPTPRPARTAKKQEAPKPKEAKRLFSRQATGDVIATTAIGNLPRGVRGGRLCVTELREQLQNGLPPYFPDLLPSSPLDESATVIDVPEAAFRMNGEWYDLSYRCEVDTNATKVVAFALRVGGQLPLSERQRRELPIR
jgi:hypothetical protein